MRTSTYVFSGLVFAILVPRTASASLVSFDIVGPGDFPRAAYLSAVLTIDTNAIGTDLSGPSSYPGIVTTENGYDITQPGTGLSITLEGETYFAHSLAVYLTNDAVSIGCGSPPVPLCDYISITSDLGEIFLGTNPALGGGLSAPTLEAMSTESLSGYGFAGFPDDTFIVNPPDRQFENGIAESIVRVPEPPLGLMFVACCGLYGVGLGMTTLRRRRGVTAI